MNDLLQFTKKNMQIVCALCLELIFHWSSGVQLFCLIQKGENEVGSGERMYSTVCGNLSSHESNGVLQTTEIPVHKKLNLRSRFSH